MSSLLTSILPAAANWSLSTLLIKTIKYATLGSWGYIAFWLFRLLVYWPSRSRLTRLPGPPRVGRIVGSHLLGLLNPQKSSQTHEEYRQKYGLNMRIHGIGYFEERFLTFDPVAISYVLGRAADSYPKPWQSRRFVKNLVGNGLFVAEGEDHRRQRKIISPAFSAQALRGLQPVFFSKALELRDTIAREISTKGEKETTDINSWLWRATIDIIGLAGFAYPFNALQDETNEVYLAYRDMFQIGVGKGFTPKAMFEIYFPWLATVFPDERNIILKRSRSTIHRIVSEIIKVKKGAVLCEKGVGDYSKPKDMLTLLIQANTLEESEKKRLNDQELLDQISTLLFVGSDTTSVGTAWVLHFLSLNPEVQQKLREELNSRVASGSEAFSETEQATVMAYPYLDAVIKEALRLVPPVQSSIRVAKHDDIIPTSDGTEVFIREGQAVHVAYEAFNTSKDAWGEDALEFKPERWFDLPRKAKEMPSLVMALMSFSFGPHSCPGYQFAMLEMKALLAALIPAFVFEPSGQVIFRDNTMVVRPRVKGNFTSQLPMILRKCQS